MPILSATLAANRLNSPINRGKLVSEVNVYVLKVLTSAEMREVDRLTTEKYGVPSLTLMENAARAVVGAITERLGLGLNGKKVVVICGKGNNGGDGAAVARLLADDGAEVSAFLFGSVADTKGDANINFERLSGLSGDLSFVENASVEDVFPALAGADVVVDALFGTGVTRPLAEADAQVVELIASVRTERAGKFPLVVAVDIPSGLDADISTPIGPHASADVTVTFTAPKLANVMPPASTACRDVVVADIGSPAELIEGCASQVFEADGRIVADWLDKTAFEEGSYKKKRGHALIVAGSGEYPGAAVLTANAAMMSGTGLVTMVSPRSSREAIASRVVPEVIMRAVPETSEGAIAESAFDEIDSLIAAGVDAVGIGSGLTSESDEVRRLVKRLVEERHTPVVIDADGLKALSPLALEGSEKMPIVLTPHEGEFLRLSGLSKEELAGDRIGRLRNFAARSRTIVVLKGQRNLLAAPDGRVVLVPTGNSGLGKAGSGDTLAGIIVGFVAQATKFHVDIFDTVVAAVYVAGLAGDIAEEKWGKRVMLASDVRDSLSEAFRVFG